MGGGASVDSADKYEDIPETTISEDIRAYYQKAEALRSQIATNDLKLFNAEQRKMFKSHKKIIKTFTSRSKNQLYRLDPSIITTISKESGYGTFLKCLMTPPALTNAIMIDAATNGIGCDEMMLIRVLCTCTRPQFLQMEIELKKMKGNSFDLRKFVAGKASKDPVLKILFQYLLDSSCTRNEPSSEFPPEKVKKEASEIFTLLHRHDEPDIDIILGTLIKASRAHCEAIKASFKEQFNEELEVQLPKRFGLLVCTALKYIMCPIAVSVIRMLRDYQMSLSKPNQEFMFGILSRYEKNFIKTIDTACHGTIGGEGFVTLVNASFKGKVKDAVLAYFRNDTPDSMVEFEIVDFMEENNAVVGKWDWITEEVTAMAVRELLEKQVKNLCSFLKVKFEPIPLTNKQDYALTPFEYEDGAGGDDDDDEDEAEEADGEQAPQVLERKASLKAMNQKKTSQQTLPSKDEVQVVQSAASGLEAQKQVDMVVNYLMLLFQWYDKEGTGALDSVVFWDIVTSPEKMNLTEFGFSREEVECMEDLCDWVDNDADNDASTIGYEDVVVELACNIENCASTNSINLEPIISARTEFLRTNAPPGAEAVAASQVEVGNVTQIDENGAAAAVEGAGVQNGKIVPDLEKYIKDTFESYDSDQSGYLDINELVQMVAAMNLGCTDEDMDQIRNKWDENKDEKISWKEALPNLVAMLHQLASDSRDHWIGLVDRDSQMLFWYNIRDQSSAWMTEEDQEAYKARKIEAPTVPEYSGGKATGKRKSMFD